MQVHYCDDKKNFSITSGSSALYNMNHRIRRNPFNIKSQSGIIGRMRSLLFRLPALTFSGTRQYKGYRLKKVFFNLWEVEERGDWRNISLSTKTEIYSCPPVFCTIVRELPDFNM